MAKKSTKKVPASDDQPADEAAAKESAPTGPEECFVIMPISDIDPYPKGHFNHVFEDLISPACEEAGYEVTRADRVKETNLIHVDILKRLLESPMAVCDLSGRNPNVLFELGLRQAFDKPTVLLKDNKTPQIFDVGPLRQIGYEPALRYGDVIAKHREIVEAIEKTRDQAATGEGVNSLIKLLAISSAQVPESDPYSSDALLRVLLSEFQEFKSELRKQGKPRKLVAKSHLIEHQSLLDEAEAALAETGARLHTLESDKVLATLNRALEKAELVQNAETASVVTMNRAAAIRERIDEMLKAVS